MDSESMSRSSTKDLSTVTSAASTPATSSTISASPFWMSSLLTENPFLLLASPAGWSHRSLDVRSRQSDDLSRVGQARSEADEQRHVTAAHLTRGAHVVERERDGSGRGVAG